MGLRRGGRERERGGRNADHHGRWDDRGDSGPQHRLVQAGAICRATGARRRLILIALQRPRAGDRTRRGFACCDRSDLWAGGRIWRGRGAAGGAWRGLGKLRMWSRGGRRSRRYSGLAAALRGYARFHRTCPAGRLIRRCPAAQVLRLERAGSRGRIAGTWPRERSARVARKSLTPAPSQGIAAAGRCLSSGCPARSSHRPTPAHESRSVYAPPTHQARSRNTPRCRTLRSNGAHTLDRPMRARVGARVGRRHPRHHLLQDLRTGSLSGGIAVPPRFAVMQRSSNTLRPSPASEVTPAATRSPRLGGRKSTR